MKTRGFELVSTHTDKGLLPERATENAAGYDLKVAEEVVIKPGEIGTIHTGLKAYMQHDEVLYLYDRSSNHKKLGVELVNSVGVIDSDYYNNEGNEGHILAKMRNITDEDVTIPVGTRIVQGVFTKYLKADGDEAKGTRTGGFGSTN